MGSALLALRLVLAAVFAIAGVTKLASPRLAQATAADFGVPRMLVTPVAISFPMLELAISGALTANGSARWGAVSALGLLAAFSGAMLVNLSKGRRPDCHCFGQLAGGPIGWQSLVRNGVLAAVAVIILAFGWSDPGRSLSTVLGDVTGAEWAGIGAGLVLAATVATLTSLLLKVVAQQGRFLERIEALENRLGQGSSEVMGLPVGSPAPEFSILGLDAERHGLSALRALGRPVLLIFSDAQCGPCAALLPDVARWQRDYAERLTIAVIGRGDVEDYRGDAERYGVRFLLLQEDREVAEAYRYPGTPSAVLVSPDGRIASGLAAGGEAIAEMAMQATEETFPGQLAVAAGAGSNGHSLINGEARSVAEPRSPSLA